MQHRFSSISAWLLTIIVLTSTQACTMARSLVVTEVSPSQTPGLISTHPPIQDTKTPLPQNEIVATLTPTKPSGVPSTEKVPLVTITAVKGNLFIRRGPNMAYNPISILAKGQTVTALARDVLARWLQVPLPGQPDKTGWVSIQTDYSQVVGEVRGLPEIMTTDWPVASYIRNCTYHQMLVEPGDVIIPSLLGAPDNEVWIYPGTYTVYDYDLQDLPEIMGVNLHEGIEIDIREDGNGEHRKCP
jgi:hypothetical protein